MAYAVEFYPSYDELVKVATIHADAANMPQLTKLALQVFFAIHTVAVPLILFYLDELIWAAVAFAINVAFSVFVLPYISRVDYRRHFESTCPSYEQELYRVKLRSNGIICEQHGDFGFVSWGSVKSVHETDDSIIVLFRGGNGVGIANKSFADDEQRRKFLNYAVSQRAAARIPSPRDHGL